MSRNDELFVVLFVERAARMAEALGPACEAGEAGLSGAVARAISGGHLTVTPELAKEARRWRLRQAGQEEEDETDDELADRRALEERLIQSQREAAQEEEEVTWMEGITPPPDSDLAERLALVLGLPQDELAEVQVEVEIQEPAALDEEEELTPEPLEAPGEEEVTAPALDSPEMREAVTTAAAALGALFGAVGAPVEPAPTPDVAPATPDVAPATPDVAAAPEAVDEDIARVQAMIAEKAKQRRSKPDTPASKGPRVAPTLSERLLTALRRCEGRAKTPSELAMMSGETCASDVEAALVQAEAEGQAEQRGGGWVLAGSPVEVVEVRAPSQARRPGVLLGTVTIQIEGTRRYYVHADGRRWQTLAAAQDELAGSFRTRDSAREVG